MPPYFLGAADAEIIFTGNEKIPAGPVGLTGKILSGMSLRKPVKEPVSGGLRDVGFPDKLPTFHVRQRAGDLEYPVV